MADPAFDGIHIRNLYKIFGAHAGQYIGAVQGGMTKAELNTRHGHILGLRDINLTIPSGTIQVIMGLSGSGKSTLIRHINRLIDPTAGEVLVGGADVCKMDAKALRAFAGTRPRWSSRNLRYFLIATSWKTLFTGSRYRMSREPSRRNRDALDRARWTEGL